MKGNIYVATEEISILCCDKGKNNRGLEIFTDNRREEGKPDATTGNK